MSFNLRSPLVALCLLLPLSACATIRQDQLGVKTRFGRVTSGPLQPGAQFVVPGVNSILRVPARVVNREVRLEMPTREGLNVSAEVSILCRVKSEQVAMILATSGTGYEEDVIIPVFRSAAADVSSRYMAKDMHSGTRAGIEGEIRTQMMSVLEARGTVAMPGKLAKPTMSVTVVTMMDDECAGSCPTMVRAVGTSMPAMPVATMGSSMGAAKHDGESG